MKLGAQVKEEKPFLGICLGAQMMARHLGARVYSREDERVEVGYYPIRPTGEGRALFDDPQYVYQWHGQGFDLPAGAAQLAEGEEFPVQAMRYGKAAYGLQFHPELSTPMMDAWLTLATQRLSQPGAQPVELHRQGREKHDAALKAWLGRFLDHWLPPEQD